jgi:D-inositol-3-phosphate glycosyltransferase
VQRLAILSYHTSPLVQPGSGDGGGMNVYVRELASALAQAGIACDVYTRATDPLDPSEVDVEPGVRVHNVGAGPASPLPREELPAHLDEFGDRVAARLGDAPPDVLHANYWLSGVVGHRLKHELDLPLVSTFHTLARVKADIDIHEPAGRAAAEARVIECSDAICVSCDDEAIQMRTLYDADPSRIEVAPPGVLHAFFSPGDQAGARRAVGLGAGPVLLFVGRIQPLKGLDVAVEALALLRSDRLPDARMVVVGGPSGPEGLAELERVKTIIERLGVDDAVRFVPPQPHHVLSTWYRAVDVCVVPSRSESFGLVALEAAACGTPVVAAAVGGLRTLVDHGRTGLLVEDRHPAAYAAALSTVLERPDRARAMGREGAARATAYTWSTTAARLRRLYADLAQRAPVPCQ